MLWHQGQLDGALARFQQAVALRPDYVEAHYNLGNMLHEQGQLDRAVASFEQVIALQPDHAGAQMGLATCYLVAEDYRRGWPAYQRRGCMPKPDPRQNLPLWTGQPLVGRSLLLVAEQGLGDTIQFVRFARVFKARARGVVLAAQAALGRLLAAHPDVDELVPLGSAHEWPRCDFYLPLLSAPAALGTDTSTIPREVPYLWADPALSDAWRRELAEIDGLKIGIAWQGSRVYPWDRWRSLPLRPILRRWPACPACGWSVCNRVLERSRWPQSIFRFWTFPAAWTPWPAPSWTPRP